MVPSCQNEDLHACLLMFVDRLHTLVLTGPHCCERMLQGWQLIPILLVLALLILAVSYLAAQQISNRKSAEWQAKLPPIPTAFTGREKEIELILDFVLKEHIRIVSITGGPAYGKSSLSIVCAHRLLALRMQVYYVSLSEANSIETFIMAFMQSVAVKSTEEVPQEKELRNWVSSLRTRTVLVLDNVDHLTLNERLRNRFLSLLKDIVAANENVQLVVTTRYRFNIVDDFEEIHVHPLDTPQAISLLKDLILAARSADQDENMDFEVIVNKTGGIPLAIKVVGRLLKSKALSGAEIIEELSVNPLHTLSWKSFTPDEQLRRCFELSFKYLEPHEQQCFHYASRFPGSFDHKARDAIITATTGDANCLEYLIDLSLVEYNYLAKRYTMHSLLRAFAKSCVSTKYPTRRYYWLFAKHYMDLLSNYVTEAKAGGDVSVVYTTIAQDYHNILHVLQLYVNGTANHSVSDVLAFALDMFNIMQPRFPWKALADWWTKILKNTCSIATHDLDSFEALIPKFVELSTKFGKLLLHYNQTLPAKRVLVFSKKCVYMSVINQGMKQKEQCLHPYYSHHSAILQVLESVYERNGEVQQALNLRTRRYSCVSSQSWYYPDSTMPEDVCSDGIAYLKQQVSHDPGDFQAVLLLFDALFNCSRLQDAHVELQRLESAYHNYQIHTQHERELLKATVAVAKRFQLVLNYRKEVEWLTSAAECVTGELTLFHLHFLLTRLYWHKLDNQEEAVKHGKTAYDLAIHFKNQTYSSTFAHGLVFVAAVRLADILHQIDGRHTDAAQYFQEALDRLPFTNADAELIYNWQEFVVSHLMSIDYQSSQHLNLFKHYGQWADLKMSQMFLQVQKLLNLPYHPQISRGTSIAEVDDSLDHIFGIGGTARQFMNACVMEMQKIASFHFIWVSVYFVLFIVIPVLLAARTCCCSCFLMYRTTVTIRTALFTSVWHLVLLPLYCAHYFLFYAVTKHKLWVPHHVPVIPKLPKPINSAIQAIFVRILRFTTVYIITWVLCLSGLYLWSMHSHSVASPEKHHHNITMHIVDNYIYNDYW